MPECDNDALTVRIKALETLLDEREDRTKERFASMKIAVDAALGEEAGRVMGWLSMWC